MTALPSTLDEMVALLQKKTPQEKAKLVEIAKHHLEKCWLPQPGPQYEAYHSKADELLYGGAVGGGKSDLLVGLATTAHEKSLLFRAQSKDLDGLWDRLSEVVQGRVASENGQKKTMALVDGRKIEGGHLDQPGSEKNWQGRPHDLIGVDEGAQIAEFKVAFVIQWLRSTTGRRCRLVVATNPPLPEYRDGKLVDFGSGDWLIRWWAPWLDSNYPHPAKPGELRWCYMQQEGERFVTVWVDGPGGYRPGTTERVDRYDEDDVLAGRVVVAKSRTFIRSLLKDNAYLAGTGYAERLSTTPEPLRTMLLTGQFGVKLEDSPMQVIPTHWVTLANERWLADRANHARYRQLLLSGDVAQGGIDNATYAPWLERNVCDDVISDPGSRTPDGPAVAARVLELLHDDAMIVLDGTGGWAGDANRTLRERYKLEPELFVASHASHNWTRDQRFKFGNMRAEMWWTFREALDPKSGYDIQLPPNARLLAQLTTPTWRAPKDVLYVEAKEDIRKRLNGASTDEADAVIQGWLYYERAKARVLSRPADIVKAYNDPQYGKLQEAQAAADDYDPLKDW